MALLLLTRSSARAIRESAWRSVGLSCTRCFAAAPQAATPDSPTFEVPAGHAKSDLSSTACNIGLNRRRDLTMRQDIRVFVDGTAKSIADVFKGHTSVFFGVPDMGKVCSEKHAPGYVDQVAALKKLGVDKVWTVAVADSEAMADWAKKIGLDVFKGRLVVRQNRSLCSHARRGAHPVFWACQNSEICRPY
eukprot:jgi/Botrbrau1/8923/Bobra.0148s0036.1